jgi:hypothetical protein
VDNIEFDCELRKARARERQPLRILIPVGGAGAQKTFVTNFVKALKVRKPLNTVPVVWMMGLWVMGLLVVEGGRMSVPEYVEALKRCAVLK